MDSLKCASDALLALEGASQDDSREACALLEDGVPAEGLPNAVRVKGEARLEIAVGKSFSSRLENAGPHGPRLPDPLMLCSYVLPHEWNHPLADTVAPSLKAAWEIIDRQSPFNKRESLVTYMRDLYPFFSEY